MDTKTHARIINALRDVFRFSSEKRAVIAKARRGKTFLCATCNRNFLLDEVRVDHVHPVIPVTGFVDWNSHIDRMFHGEMQIVCKTCHHVKTQSENKLRRENKKAAKKLARPEN